LGDGAVEDGEGLGAGAVDGGLGGVGDASCLGFGLGAATEAPCGAEDFGGEGFFEGVGGAEAGEEGGVEVVVFGLFFGADDAFGGEEAEFGRVLGGSGFALFGLRAGGELGVEAVLGDLGFGGGHFGRSFGFCWEVNPGGQGVWWGWDVSC
jgi:hypothetical protein